MSKLPKLSEMGRAREAAQMREVAQNALMALVKAAGPDGLAVPLDALRELKVGDQLEIVEHLGEGLVLRFHAATEQFEPAPDGGGNAA